jgi:hypothetical protein
MLKNVEPRARVELATCRLRRCCSQIITCCLLNTLDFSVFQMVFQASVSLRQPRVARTTSRFS